MLTIATIGTFGGGLRVERYPALTNEETLDRLAARATRFNELLEDAAECGLSSLLLVMAAKAACKEAVREGKLEALFDLLVDAEAEVSDEAAVSEQDHPSIANREEAFALVRKAK